MRIKTVTWLLILGLVVHVGYKVISVYIDYGRMEDVMSTKASLAQVLHDEDIRKDLVAKANELGLPLQAEHFVLERDAEHRTMAISTAWDAEVSFLGGLAAHTFHFAPRVEQTMMQR